MVTPSFTVTVYQMTLGDTPDPDTGWFPRNYTPVIARIPIVAKGSALPIMGTGYYAKTDGLGMTDQNLQEDDIIEQVYGVSEKELWLIAARRPNAVGNVLLNFFVDLMRQEVLPFVAGSGGSGVYHGYDPRFYDSRFYDYSLLYTVP
jgi:hypothetical protein